jgi:adapter protein MecA 1/2
MRLERMNPDKIRIFLTFDDLSERGINKEDIWQDIPKVHELFNDMMDQAYHELDFEVSGPVAVEVFSLPAQGMVVIVTKGKNSPDKNVDKDLDDEDLDDDEDFYELEVTLDETDDVLFVFKDFEDVVHVAHKLEPFIAADGRLLKYDNLYYLLLEELAEETSVYDLIIAILSEFGEASMKSKYMLQEYGSIIIEKQAIGTINKHFKIT